MKTTTQTVVTVVVATLGTVYTALQAQNVYPIMILLYFGFWIILGGMGVSWLFQFDSCWQEAKKIEKEEKGNSAKRGGRKRQCGADVQLLRILRSRQRLMGLRRR